MRYISILPRSSVKLIMERCHKHWYCQKVIRLYNIFKVQESDCCNEHCSQTGDIKLKRYPLENSAGITTVSGGMGVSVFQKLQSYRRQSSSPISLTKHENHTQPRVLVIIQNYKKTGTRYSTRQKEKTCNSVLETFKRYSIP